MLVATLPCVDSRRLPSSCGSKMHLTSFFLVVAAVLLAVKLIPAIRFPVQLIPVKQVQ